MYLSWLGISAFKIETKDAVIVTDPFSPEVSKKPLRAKADIVTVSRTGDPAHHHLSGIQGEPFIIDHPGEFEVKGIFIQGIPFRGQKGTDTLFTIDIEGMRLLHLGGVADVPPDDLLEKADGVDILFVPVGGGVTLNTEQAAGLISDIEPKVVIPMLFAQEKAALGTKLAPVSSFLKEMGISGGAPEERVLIKKRDLPEEETRTIVFRS